VKYWCRILISLLIVYTYAVAQAPDTLWTRAYGGFDMDAGESIIVTQQGYYLAVGATRSYGAGNFDIFAVMVDDQGNQLWASTYGGSGSDIGKSVVQIDDNSFVIAGWTESYGAGGQDMYVVMIDSLGDTVWTKTYGGVYDDRAYAITNAQNNACVLAGVTNSPDSADLYIIKINATGDTLWTKTHGDSLFDEARGVQHTYDGGYIITGYTDRDSTGYAHVYLVKTDTLGNVIWEKTYGYGYPTAWFGEDVIQTTDSGYVITGHISQTVGTTKILCLRINNNGDTLWVRTYLPGLYDEGCAVIETSDGFYTLIGTMWYPTDGFIYMIKISPNGDSLWSCTFGEGGESGRDIQQTPDNGYIITGETHTYGGGNGDIWLIKTEPDMGILEKMHIPIVGVESRATILSGPLPLPGTLKYKIFDITGRQIHTLNPAPGIYFIEVDGEIRQKIVKVR